MAEHFYTILTEIGKASIANASALGTKVDFKYMALGDGNGSYYNPNEKQTELKKEVYRSQINHVQIDSENDNWITLSTIIPANIGGFTVREVGAFDVDGNLLVIGKVPETYKPKLEDGSSKDLTINMILEVSNASVVNLKIDPSVILATKKELDDRLKTKVDKVPGKGLSENDFTTILKDKLGGMAEGANKYTHPLTHPPEIIEQDADNRFISDLELAQIENNKRDLGTHLADITNQEGRHGIRYFNEKLEIKVNGVWIEFKSGSQYPVGNVSGFSAKSDDKQVTLTWQDPEDRTITDNNGEPLAIAKWKGTKILRKTGSYPANENDGVLVVDNGIRDQYKTNGFIDTGLINDTDYYYMAFPYTEEDVFTVDVVNRISAIPTEIKIYGIEIDEANSNPKTAVTYTDDAVGFIPASGNNGAFDWGSWESIIKDEFMIRPCVLNNPAKTVNYYLDYDNYNLKATGGASNLTGADGDVMTEFGADIYTKWTVVGSKHKIQFSIKPFEGAAKNAFETENGYNQFLYYPLLLTQKLFQMIFKNRDSQTALGRGYVDGNSAYANTGGTNTKGFMFGETTGKQQMKFLGIEDYWGNKFQWIDGLVTDASYNLLIGNSGFNDSGSGYTNHASGVSANTAGYIDTVQGGNDKGFIIKGKSGSETTHYCDYGYLGSSRVASFGGHLSSGSFAGFAVLRLDGSASLATADFGSRLFCKNNGKLYIGAYLGTTQGGKLRSVSGAVASDNKTIGAFRNEARANNI